MMVIVFVITAATANRIFDAGEIEFRLLIPYVSWKLLMKLIINGRITFRNAGIKAKGSTTLDRASPGPDNAKPNLACCFYVFA
jgi:hypothetical protein